MDARVLVLGATGMLGQALRREAGGRRVCCLGVARSGADIALDLTDDRGLTDLLERTAPEIIINAAAVTDLAQCERDPDTGYRLNARLPAVMAELCAARGTYLVQVSTDHYFTGDGDAKHKEESPVRLVNEYARTKYAGERFALTCPSALVVRTNIVGFRGWQSRPTFLECALASLGNHGSDMTLFSDCYTSSIEVGQFARALFHLLESRPAGVLNVASREVSSKQAFIQAVARQMGFDVSHARTGSVKELKDVPRAESLGLDVAKAEALLGHRLPGLQEVATSVAAGYRERADAVRHRH